MDRSHVGAETNGRTHCFVSRVRNVVKLEIQKDLQASFLEGFNDRRALRREELQANLDPGHSVLKIVGQAQSGRRIRRVQRHDDFFFSGTGHLRRMRAP